MEGGAVNTNGTAPAPLDAVRRVLALELTQRVRSTRWRATLTVWFAVLVGSVMLQVAFFRARARAVGPDEVVWDQSSGEAIVHGTLLFVLLVGLVIAPAQSATAINGDRRDGVLALVQATPVPTWALLAGKLLAAWLASLAFLVVSLPVLVWAVLMGGLSMWAMLLGVAVVALLLLAVAGIGLGLSAATPRTGSSTMLAYFVVAALLAGLPLVYALAAPMTGKSETLPVAHVVRNDVDHATADPAQWCEVRDTPVEYSDTRALAWLFIPDPMVILADAVPHAADSVGPMPYIRNVVDATFREPAPPPATCRELADSLRETSVPVPSEGTGPGWKWAPGLAIDMALGFVGLLVAHRRLRVPAGALPRGVRIA